MSRCMYSSSFCSFVCVYVGGGAFSSSLTFVVQCSFSFVKLVSLVLDVLLFGGFEILKLAITKVPVKKFL